MKDSKLGDLLIKNGLITKEQFEHAMELQKRSSSLPLGKLLSDLGYLRRETLDSFLDEHEKREKLGDILRKQKLIDERVLNDALQLSKKEKIPLGRALIKLQAIEESQLSRAIATQQDWPYVTIEKFKFNDELAKLFNPSYARRHKIIPIGKDGRHVTLAMAFPLRRDEIQYLEAISNTGITPVIASESDILIGQQKLYNLEVEGKLPGKELLNFEISEDSGRETTKSKYVEFISANAEYLVKKILSVGIKVGASDIHLESSENGMTVRYRVDGMLQKVDLGGDLLYINDNSRQIISKIKILCEMDIAERRRPQDSSFKMRVNKDTAVRSVDFRVSTIPTQFGENVVIRILDTRSTPISLELLGLSPHIVEEVDRVVKNPTGIFLVTGPTGSGKSSTLYAALGKLHSPKVKTLTIEDPIEYSLDGVCQTEVNETIGNSFAKLLRAFLRQDPDVIMVGEIRDPETAEIAMRAALTGHMVISTLHTNDSTSVVLRLMDMGIEPGLISSTLRGVLAQRLVRRICPLCTTRYNPPLSLLRDFGLTTDDDYNFQQGSGCSACNYTGYSKRFPIGEIWVPEYAELVALNKVTDNLALRKNIFTNNHRISLVEDGIRRVKAGETTLEELMRVIPYEQITAEKPVERQTAKLIQIT